MTESAIAKNAEVELREQRQRDNSVTIHGRAGGQPSADKTFTGGGQATAAKFATLSDQMETLLAQLTQAESVIGHLKQSADETAETLLRRVQAIKREIGGA